VRVIGTILLAVAWAAVVVSALVALSQVVGTTGHPLLYVLQAFTLHAVVGLAVVAAIAALLRRPWLAGSGVVVAIVLATVVVPAITARSAVGATAAGPDAARLTVVHANTYYANRRVPVAADVIAAAVERDDADLVVVTELSPDLESALLDRIGDEFVHRAGEATDERNGLGVFSRLPLSDVRFGPYRTMPGIEVTVRPDGVTPIRVIGVHPVPGVEPEDLTRWHVDLEHIGDRATAAGEPPTLVVGDFNASRWHPPFRRLLDRGLADAHEYLGRGLSSSWPVSWWRPRFVRLDHALVDDRVAPVSVRDLVVPGSDHTGFVVTVAVSPTAP
jgi:endonuclease/exonuclease/phosphatase (EEP) superfamily protein YafD